MKALVTGGAGFLGRAIINKLLTRGDQVRTYSRGDYPDLAKAGVEVFRGDIHQPQSVAEAVRGCDAVFHTAAKAGVWGRYQEFYYTNFIGTKNVIEACLRHGVPRLIHTSTPSVVHAGRNVEAIDESAPYATRFEAHYPKTKTMAEKAALAANGDRLSVVALRPHLIWGPGDPNFVPRIIERAKAGRLMRISGGPYIVDSLYIDNAADAHLLAADRLEPGSPVAGKAYFITQGEPIDSGELIDRILAAAGLPPMEKSVPPWLALFAGAALEAIYSALSLRKEPPMTRFVARQLSTSHYFDISAARRDLDYNPAVSIDQGMERLREYLRASGLA